MCIAVAAIHKYMCILCRLCELGKQEETGESSMAVRGEGEGVRELEDRDGSGGLRDRVVCLSALIPVMAAYASLHPMVHSGQFHMLHVHVHVHACTLTL